MHEPGPFIRIRWDVASEAGIRDLRDHLSRYLERVQAGEQFTVTDRGRPIAVDEPGAFERLVAEGLVTSVRLIYTEARVALAHAERRGWLTSADLSPTLDGLERLHRQLDLLEVDDLLVRRAGELAPLHALRGYDARHLAGAERVHGATTIVVAGGSDLCTAAGTLGLAVATTSVDGGGPWAQRPWRVSRDPRRRTQGPDRSATDRPASRCSSSSTPQITPQSRWSMSGW